MISISFQLQPSLILALKPDLLAATVHFVLPPERMHMVPHLHVAPDVSCPWQASATEERLVGPKSLLVILEAGVAGNGH